MEQRKRAAEQSTKSYKEDAPSVSNIPRQSVDYKEVCFIWERVRDRKGIYHKRLIEDFKRQTAVHRQAKLLKDDALLTKIEGHGETCKDLIAADFRYHQSCMNSFLGRSYSEAESVIPPDNSVYDQAFIQFIQEIHEPLNQGQVFYTSDLCAKYKEFLRQREIITSYKTNNLIQRFYNHYGPNIQIVPQKGTSSNIVLCRYICCSII